jgi:hypothetical protein
MKEKFRAKQFRTFRTKKSFVHNFFSQSKKMEEVKIRKRRSTKKIVFNGVRNY